METERIASYTLKQKIGSGGMSKVYFAVNNLGDPFAIKLLNTDLAENETIRKRFRNEMEALKSLRDLDQVCQIKDFYEDGKQMAIVMEYLTGVNLLTYIRSNGALPPQQLISWMQQLLPPFAICHARKIVHRDVKPSNFFLTDSGKLKILDFGIAKALDQNEVQLNSMAMGLTNIQEVLGSPMYMSPEQVRGLQEIDHRTDIYSLGVMIYTLLVGHNPYEGLSTRSNYDIQESIVKKTLPQLAGELAVFNPIIQKATQKEPGERHQSIQSLLNDLNAITIAPNSEVSRPVNTESETAILNEPVQPITPSPAERKERKSRSHSEYYKPRTSAPVPAVATTPDPVTPSARISVKSMADSQTQGSVTPIQSAPLTLPKPATVPRKGKQKGIFVGLFLLLAIAALIYSYRESPSENSVPNVTKQDDQPIDSVQVSKSVTPANPPTVTQQPTATAVTPTTNPTASDNNASLPSWRATRLLVRLAQIPHETHPAVFAAARRAFADLKTVPNKEQTIDSLYTMCVARATQEKFNYQRTSDFASKQDAIEWYNTAYTLKPTPYLTEQIKLLDKMVINAPAKKPVKKPATGGGNVDFIVIPTPKQ